MSMNLTFLNIYTDAIDRVIDGCEETLKKLGFSISEIDHVNDQAFEYLKEFGSFEDITNSIIRAYLTATVWAIEARFPDKNASYYANGYDSYLHIDGETLF